MRYRAWVAAAACSLAVAFTGCSGSSDTRNTSAETPQAAESARRGGGGSAEAARPARAGHLLGGARRISGGSGLLVRRLSPGAVHRTRTQQRRSFVFSLAEPTIAEAVKDLNYCWDDVRVVPGHRRGELGSVEPGRLPAQQGGGRRRRLLGALRRDLPDDHRPQQRSHHQRVRQGDRRRSTGRLLGLHRQASRWGRSAVRPVRPAAQLRTDRKPGHLGWHHRVPVRGRTFGRGSATVSRRGPGRIRRRHRRCCMGSPLSLRAKARRSQAGASCSTPMGGRCLPGRGFDDGRAAASSGQGGGNRS